MLITAHSFPATHRLHSLEFTLVNKSYSEHSVVAVGCEGRHFLILYACAHEVLFPGQIPRSLIWERHLAHKGNEPRARLARSFSVVVGKVCVHHTDNCQLIATLNKVATHSCDAMMVSCQYSFLCWLQLVSHHVNEVQEIGSKIVWYGAPERLASSRF